LTLITVQKTNAATILTAQETSCAVGDVLGDAHSQLDPFQLVSVTDNEYYAPLPELR